MARTPSGDRMRASSATHPFPAILPSAVAVTPSSFAGNPITTPLNITQLSSSNASIPFGPTATSGVTVIETCATPANQKVLARPIPTVFLPPNSNISLGSIPYGHVRGFVADRSFLEATPIPTGTSATSSSLPLSLSSVSHSTGPSRTINRNLSVNAPLSHTGPSQDHVSAMLTDSSQVEEAFDGYTTDIIFPDVSPLFLQWLHARRAWMTSQGRIDPLLVGPSFLAQMFDRWLQQWWPLFGLLRIGTPGTNPSGWVGIFDLWFSTLSIEHTSSPSPSQKTSGSASDTPAETYQAPELAIAGLASTPPESRNKKHYRNDMSTLTVQQIQRASTEAGGDADAIQRLAAVFPPGDVVMRDALKVGRKRKSRVGHRGYQEFSGLVDGQWYCQLCNRIGGRTWKNEKDILNHVWNKHCDLSPLG